MNVAPKRVIVLPKLPPLESDAAAKVVEAVENAQAPDVAAATDPAPSTGAPTANPERNADAPRSSARSPALPLALALLALLAFLLDQTELRWRERQQLQQLQAELQPQVDRAKKLRGQLDRLAADTQRLADAGNANAGALVEELRRRGITINAAAAPR